MLEGISQQTSLEETLSLALIPRKQYAGRFSKCPDPWDSIRSSKKTAFDDQQTMIKFMAKDEKIKHRRK